MTVAESFAIATEDGAPPIAVVRLTPQGVFFMWLPDLFLTGAINEELRGELVKLLRYHADRLEQHDIDRKMFELLGKAAS